MENNFNNFDPNGVGLKNGHFIGLPFTEEDARIVLLSVPWDVTVSYGDGTANGPDNILEASTQLDLYDENIPNAWQSGIYMRPSDSDWKRKNKELRSKAKEYIRFLEAGGNPSENSEMKEALHEINRASELLAKHVESEASKLLASNKLVGVVGGDHSSPLGLLKALTKKHASFGILHIDAHMDLRNAYEGFTYSHASIFYNAIHLPQIEKLVQVGVRDFCEEEVELAEKNKERVKVFSDYQLKSKKFQNISWQKQCDEIIEKLPEKVYISLDIDGLQPVFCPGTGTPVPGGLSFEEVVFLMERISLHKTIIGFDLCEVAGKSHPWDGNVGARLLYKMSNLMAKTNAII